MVDKKEVKKKVVKTVKLNLSVWKKINKIRTDEDFKTLSDVIEDLLKKKGSK